MTRQRTRAMAAVAMVPALLLGCSDDDEPEVPEIPSETTAAETPASPQTTATAEAAPTAGVPELCSDLIETIRVAQIVETPMPGGVRRVYNDEYLESSGRIGRLTCEYGIERADDDESPSASPGADDDGGDEESAILEIAVSAYTEADIAEGRISDTVSRVGGEVEAQTVGQGTEGFLLRDDEDVSLIFAEGVQTYVITIVRGFVPEPAEPIVLTSLANEILGGDAESE